MKKGTKKERTHREKEDAVFSKIKVACIELSKRKFRKRKYQISRILNLCSQNVKDGYHRTNTNV